MHLANSDNSIINLLTSSNHYVNILFDQCSNDELTSEMTKTKFEICVQCNLHQIFSRFLFQSFLIEQ